MSCSATPECWFTASVLASTAARARYCSIRNTGLHQEMKYQDSFAVVQTRHCNCRLPLSGLPNKTRAWTGSSVPIGSTFVLYYRQHCTQRNAPVFKLLRGRFLGFLPAGVTRCTDGGEIWHGGRDLRSTPPCQISPIGMQQLGYRTPKTDIFTEIWSKCGI